MQAVIEWFVALRKGKKKKKKNKIDTNIWNFKNV